MMRAFQSLCSTISSVASHRIFSFPWKVGRLTGLCLALAVVVCGSGNFASAQVFAGYQSVQSVVVSTGLSFPQQVAVDGSGNVYIADTGNDRILMETPLGSGYMQSTVPSSTLDSPYGVAVDRNGNVYIADSVNGRVLKETLSGGNYTESVVSATGPNRRPQGLAVDGNGNVFVADPGYAALFEEAPAAGNTYTETIIRVQYNYTGNATEVAVDQNDNLYVTTGGGDNGPVVLKLVPSGSTYVAVGEVSQTGALSVAADNSGDVFLGENGSGVTEEADYGSLYLGLTVDQTLIYPSGIAADGNGNLYVADYKNNRVVKDVLWNGNFGTVDVGTPSQTLSLIFKNNSFYPVVMGTPSVVTQGVTGLDFADAGTGSCTINGPTYSYTSGKTCTADVVFTPKNAGPRMGAVNLINSSGTVAAAAYLRGTGWGMQVDFLPGSQSALSFSNVNSPYALATDAAGSLYIAEAVSVNSPNNAVVKEAWSGSSYTQTTVATGLGYPVGVAVDGEGNVLIADQGASTIVRATPSAGGYTVNPDLVSISSVEGVAVDGIGNFYVSSSTLGVLKETYAGQGWGYARSTIDGSVTASGIAVDGAGNVYLGDSTNDQALKETLSNGSYTLSSVATGLNSPYGLSVDTTGNVYIADAGNNRILKETPSGSGYTESTLASGLNNPEDVSVDGSGNVYITNVGNAQVLKEDFADAPSLTFATTAYGATSADSPQTVTVENMGNAALNFPVSATENNPSITTSFTWDSSGTSACPLVSAGSSAPGTLASGASCLLPISFVPAAVGTLSGSLALTDSNLYAPASAYLTQSITLQGIAIQATPSIRWATPAAITYGTALSGTQLDASSPVVGSFLYSPAAGTVLGSGSQKLNVTLTPNDATDYTTATGSVTLTVNQATPINVLGTSANPAFLSNQVIFTATISSSAGTPSGTVSFYDGTTLLGQGTLNSGLATYQTSALTVGPHSITAAYSGDGNYIAITSAAVVETIEDFTLVLASGSASATVSPGDRHLMCWPLTRRAG